MKNRTPRIASIWRGIGRTKRLEAVDSKSSESQRQPNAPASIAELPSDYDRVDIVNIRGVDLPVSRRCACVTTGDIRGD